MWFLLIKIFFLLLIAAALGAMLGYWLLKSRYEDITEHYTDLAMRLDAAQRTQNLLSRDDFEDGVKYLEDKLDTQLAANARAADEKFQYVASTLLTPKPEPVKPPDDGLLRRIDDRMARLATRIAAQSDTDLRPLEAELRALRRKLDAHVPPEPDLTPLASAIDRVDQKLAGLSDEIAEAHARDQQTTLDELHKLTESMTAGMSAIEPVDISPLRRKLHDVERALIALDRPDVNLSPLEKDIARIGDQISDMRNDIHSLPDLDPVIASIGTVARRIDYSALEHRLTAIEYGLAALHHTLRARTDQETQSDTVQASLFSTQTDAPHGPASDNLSRMSLSHADTEPRRSAGRDAVQSALREGGHANLLKSAAFGRPDNLTAIDGIGPMLHELLNQLGVYYFWQIAEWDPADADEIDTRLLRFKGRIARDRWIEQARKLARGEFAARRP